MRRIVPAASVLLFLVGFVLAENDNPFAPVKSADAYYELAMKSLIAGEQKEAERLLEEGLGVYYNDQRLMFLDAACLRSRFDVEPASVSFFAVQLVYPESVYGRAAAEIIALDRGEYLTPEQHFEELEKLADKNPDDLVLRWMVAVQCRSFDRAEEGIRHYRKIVAAWKPGPVLVHQTFANLLDSAGRHEEALPERRKAVELEPAAWSLQGLGATLGHLKQYKEADEAFRKSVEYDPGRRNTWSLWAFCLIDQERYAEAIEKLENYLEINKYNWELWKTLGSLHRKLGNDEKAVSAYSIALQINPFSEDMYYDRGGLYLHGKQFDRAIADFNKAIELDSTKADVFNSRGVAYRMKFQFRKAIASFDEAVSLDPKYVMAWANRAFAYLHIGETDKAIADASEAIRLDRDYLDAYQTRASAYRAKGDLDREIADLTEIIRLSPENKTAYQMRAAAHETQGNASAAEADMDKARVLDYRFP